MALRINDGLYSLLAQQQISKVSSVDLARSLGRLQAVLGMEAESGDVASFSVNAAYKAKTQGIQREMAANSDTQSKLQTALGSLEDIGANTERLQELTALAADEGTSDEQRQIIQAEADRLIADINNLAANTTYNNQNLLDGTFTGQRTAGAASEANPNAQIYSSELLDELAAQAAAEEAAGGGEVEAAEPAAFGSVMDAAQALAAAPIDLSSVEGAEAALELVGDVNDKVVTQTADFAKVNTRLEDDNKALNDELALINDLREDFANDVEAATLVADFTKEQIILQVGTAMLAQASLMPQVMLNALG